MDNADSNSNNKGFRAMSRIELSNASFLHPYIILNRQQRQME